MARGLQEIEQMLELGFGEPDDRDKAVAQANRENNMMLHGAWMSQAGSEVGPEDSFKRASTAVPVKQWHNHEIHVQRHTNVMMDEEFDRLTTSHPQIVRLFDEHIAMHQQAIAEQQHQQMLMLMASKGAPDGPPGAASSPNGQGDQSTMMAQSATPDVIGGGNLQMSTRNISPTPGAGGGGAPPAQ